MEGGSAHPLHISFLLICLFSICSCSSFVGLEKQIDSISYGTLDVKAGVSNILTSFPLVTFNAPQFAYSPSTNLYSFIAYDSGNFNSFLLSLNASTGKVVYNASFASPPAPFGLQYDTSGNLYGQVWWANGTAALTTVNVKTLAMQAVVGTSWVPGAWWTFVSSTFSAWNDSYYSLFWSPTSESLVGINVLNGQVNLNITLGLDTTLGVATALQYNNVTNTFYVIGFNNATLTYDLATVNHATGSLTYLNVFTNATLGDVTGVGLDNINNILSIVYVDGYASILVNVDLKANAILSTTKLASNSISTMLALATNL